MNKRTSILVTFALLFAGLVAWNEWPGSSATSAANEGLFVGHAATLAGAGGLILVVVLQRLLTLQDRRRILLKREVDSLRNQMETETAYSSVLGQINRLIEVFGRTRDLDAVLDAAADALRNVLQVDALVLRLYSSEESRFFKLIERGVVDLDLGEDIHKDVLQKRKSHLINQLRNYPRYQHLSAQGYGALMVAPLVRNDPDGTATATGLVAALTSGPRDFSSKHLNLLTTFSRQAALIIENAQLYEKTRHMATHDGLTNLVNHVHFKEVLNAELAACMKQSEPLILMMGDIDYFKHYNDTNGHQEGDQVLRAVADVMLACTRGSDVVARYGGEEFVVILPRTNVEGARAVAENIHRRIGALDLAGAALQPAGRLTITFGLARFPEDAPTPDNLIQVADKALYYGKQHGKDQLVEAGLNREAIEREFLARSSPKPYPAADRSAEAPSEPS